MRTIKLVIIGDSGVGKTSLRSTYISGRFSAGYRATIGTDFITKTLLHYNNSGETVTLQIWDTAGQERFSSLSTAFFRGADAVLMMYDVNNPATLQGLRKWWKDFQERAPVPDEEASDYCCVVVGNKIDLADAEDGISQMAVSERDVQTLLQELIPPSLSPSGSYTTVHPGHGNNSRMVEGDLLREEPALCVPKCNVVIPLDSEEDDSHPKPIDIGVSGHANRVQSVSRATSRSRLNGTMTTTRTGLSVYHTPSSSLFDEFVSAPSSPIHSSNPSAATSRTFRPSVSPTPNRRRSTNLSLTSTSATIRPTSVPTPSPPTIIPLDRGPKLFLTSAKTGYAVSSVFEYVAQRVVARWEWEESVQARTLDFAERAGEIRTAHLSQPKNGGIATCCS